MDEHSMRESVSGFEVYRSPEFQAFCRKFGIELEFFTTEITIKITEDKMEVSHNYMGSKLKEKAALTKLVKEA